MPREARLFSSSAGSAVRGYLKYRANIPPRWIKNARGSRKDRRRFPFAQKSADQETKSKSRYSERAARIALGIASLGNSLSQGEFLSRYTNPLGIAAGRLLKSVDPNCPIDQCAHSGSSRTGMYSGRYLRRTRLCSAFALFVNSTRSS